MHERRGFLLGAIACAGVFFAPLPREMTLVQIRVRSEHRTVADVLESDPRTELGESGGRVAGKYLRRVEDWKTEPENSRWGFWIRRNGDLILGAPLTMQRVSFGDIIRVSVRFA